jgi:gamma-glutamyl-gamma-aminobutyrate hydrolase PuuD
VKTTKGRIVAIRQHAPDNKEELWQSVHVVGPENGPGFAQMLARARCRKSERGLVDADIVFFTGGSCDVHPALYGADPAKAHQSMMFTNQSHIDTMMEYYEVFHECLYVGIPMVGICLGAQFLHVMNGGSLFQDVDNHYKDHSMWDSKTGEVIEVSSVHHQMCRPNDEMEVLGYSSESNERWTDRNTYELVVDDPEKDDIEAFFYRDTACLGFQGHPEYSGYYNYTEWCLKQITECLINSPDFEYRDNLLRMKSSVLNTRKFSFPDSVTKFVKEYQ